MKHMTPKATPHVSQNEGLIFEKSSPGKAAWKLPPLDVPEVDAAELLGASERKDLGNMPEVSEIEIIRHFTRLSTWNYAIDLGMYPLGSCTMKYNPRVNEVGCAGGRDCQRTPLPAGEDFAGRAADHQNSKRMPDRNYRHGCHHAATRGRRAWRDDRTADGARLSPIAREMRARRFSFRTPRTARIRRRRRWSNYAVENLKSDSRGMVDIAALEAQMNEDVAALMLTNPNTLGVFEQEIHKIADIMHAKGGLLYMDGANMNALVGKVRPGDFGVDVMHLNLHKTFSTPHGGGGPGSGPVAIKKILEPFLPTPVLITKADGTFGFRL